MRLPYKEPTAAKHIFINPNSNRLQILMPIMSGSEIGLDNTCKSVYSLQKFFSLLDSNHQGSAFSVLTDYKKALEFDLKYMQESREKTDKAQRLSQIQYYLDLLEQLEQDRRITEPLMQNFPLYPEPLINLMSGDDSNLHSIILRPEEQDNFLRTTRIGPTFSANHAQMINTPKHSTMAATFRQIYQNASFEPKSKEGLIARFLTNHPHLPLDFNQIRSQLIQEIKTYLNVTVDFETTQGQRLSPSVAMTADYMNQQLNIDANNPATTSAYINALIEYCTPNLFDHVEESPFYTNANQERLSILTQFFLAELNIACREQGISEANFGQILESNTRFSQELALAVTNAMKQTSSVEQTIIQHINQHQNRFNLTTPIPENSITSLNQKFQSHWQQIKGATHFDEFMLLSDKPGLFVRHQGYIAIAFASFALAFESSLSNSSRLKLVDFIEDYASIARCCVNIPHKNEHIPQGEMTLDLSTLDAVALKNLYQDINTHYPDKIVNQALIAQLKHERPDFIPKIDAKKFLAHVAHGEQDEAEAELQKDPNLAQLLLVTDDIPFTDYSCRTFRCTAYEYAYWAKDTHMQRMLEKYILKNEQTRIKILGRVQDIERLRPSSPSSNFLSYFSCFQQAPRPQGLTYTKQNRQGEIKHHQDAGFDLNPLMTGLKYFIDVFIKSLGSSSYQGDNLNTIWRQQVGIAQRDLPAHIAQEYCHPRRSFKEVEDNQRLLDATNPDTLIRQLQFINNQTDEREHWFNNPSLGEFFAISRGDSLVAHSGRVSDNTVYWVSCEHDLAALRMIDQLRTQERKQSLINLSQALTLDNREFQPMNLA